VAHEHDEARCVAAAQAAGLLAGAVYTVAEVMQDPHFQARNVWDTIDHPATGALQYPGRPFLLTRSPRRAPQRAPLLNEHADDLKATVAPSPRRSIQTRQDAPLGLPLAGLRIAEITVVWAGPHVTQLLAEWGAEVIRVEPANKTPAIYPWDGKRPEPGAGHCPCCQGCANAPDGQ